MAGPNLDYKAIRRRVEKELTKDKTQMRAILFVLNLVLYIVFLVIAWGMYISGGGPPIEPNIPGVSQTDPLANAMLMLSIVGGLGLIFQFISMIVDTKIGERQMRDRVVARILGEELLRLGDDEAESPREKVKRMMRLTDDGELEEIEDVLEVDNEQMRNNL